MIDSRADRANRLAFDLAFSILWCDKSMQEEVQEQVSRLLKATPQQLAELAEKSMSTMRHMTTEINRSKSLSIVIDDNSRPGTSSTTPHTLQSLHSNTSVVSGAGNQLRRVVTEVESVQSDSDSSIELPTKKRKTDKPLIVSTNVNTTRTVTIEEQKRDVALKEDGNIQVSSKTVSKSGTFSSHRDHDNKSGRPRLDPRGQRPLLV